MSVVLLLDNRDELARFRQLQTDIPSLQTNIQVSLGQRP
ncbi:MAG: hypothetical protein AVDCRST_MAG93-7754 [uncultured Chloroflexia bacterium]|uniref:Uncharacterized protein n=1 Tax=uncultured Chloroflexia bacterium TaxID=1672391 RepID=A0A6J4MN61_9CHLR|nr:MAG: hypothetical protein AVDCRST_MAG93-7754 [uncultured Chloroflexia bacterium]